jgi:ATP-dependent DNA ligase
MNTYSPMLARPAERLFDDPAWVFEVKWDGIRAIAYVGEHLSVRSRNDKELIGSFPELGELKELASNVVLDGEIIVFR